MSLPEPTDPKRVPGVHRPIVWAATLGGGTCLLAVILGLVVLGFDDQSDAQVALTGLASIGSTLAGAFAGWMARDRYRAGDGE